MAQEAKICSLRIIDCGLAAYRDVLARQHELCEKRRRDEIPNTVLIVEHPPVITLGARQSANKLLIDRDDLARRQIDIVEIRRGGGTTAHNPGQLVFYPIVNLKELNLGISRYIRKLEEIGAELLRQLGVRAHTIKGLPGLWIEKPQTTRDERRGTRDELRGTRDEGRGTRDELRGTRKIASIGVRASKLITHHGMAINIQNDLAIFDLLIPCGLDDVEMTSVLKETGNRHPMPRVKDILSQLLHKHFSTMASHSRSCDEGLQASQTATRKRRKLPDWLRRPLPGDESFHRTEEILSSLGLNTICSSANCPNRGQCWARGTATVLILGSVCTRSCRFCSVATGKPDPPDPTEPARIAQMAKRMGLKYIVITSVNRDDLPDGGAAHFRDCINEVRSQCPDMRFEILTPDFRDCQNRALEILRDAMPFVFAHNIETVPSLYPLARPGSEYRRSLDLLKTAKEAYGNVTTKSSIMLGLGETDGEVEQVLKDLRTIGCDRITIGQYLKPSPDSLEVAEYITPEEFDRWKQKALRLGFSWVISSPYARSSYFAENENTTQ